MRSSLAAFIVVAAAFAALAAVEGCVGDAPATPPKGDASITDAEANPDASDTGVEDAGREDGSRSDADAGSIVEAGPYDLIDDMESNTGVFSGGGRNGYWFGTNDGADGGVFAPMGTPLLPSLLSVARDVDGGPATTRGVHISGSGFPVFAAVGLDLVNTVDGGVMGDGGTNKQAYDARAYEGITFYARIAPSSSAFVRVSIPDGNTDPAGGVCTSCFSFYGRDMVFTTSWVKYTITFASMTQQSWGNQFPNPDLARLYGIQFNVTGAFDLWIDDISFVRK